MNTERIRTIVADQREELSRVAADSGLIEREALAYWEAWASENIGRLIENAVAVELMRMRSADPAMEVYYWKDYRQREVDFVVKRGTEVEELLQVTYASERGEVAGRELAASDELGCRRLSVVTWDYEGAEQAGEGREMRFVPLWRWLLQKRVQ